MGADDRLLVKQDEAEHVVMALGRLGRPARLREMANRGWVVETVDDKPRLEFEDFELAIHTLTVATKSLPRNDL